MKLASVFYFFYLICGLYLRAASVREIAVDPYRQRSRVSHKIQSIGKANFYPLIFNLIFAFSIIVFYVSTLYLS